MKFLAVDLGASSGRTIVGTIQDRSIQLQETHRFENAMIDQNGEKHWDVTRLIDEIRRGIDASGKTDGIGLDTWGVDYGLIDAAGNLLHQPFAYRDTRNEAAMPEVYARISRARLYEITGMQEMPFNTVFQLMADQMSPKKPLKKAERLLMIPELLGWMLSGRAVAEYSICSTSGMLDAKSRTWSNEIISALELPQRIFAPIQAPGTPAGEYQGTPIYLPGCHDTASAVAAVPAAGDDWAYLSSGTWSLIGAELSEPILNQAAMAANFTNEGGVGERIRFLKNVNGLWLIQECRRMWLQAGQKLTFAEIAAAAEAETNFSSLIDPADPRLLAPENMLETISELCREQDQAEPKTVGQFARCAYASLAQAYRRELQLLTEITGKRFNRLHIVGGGAKATLLNQLTANACGIPVYAGPFEATALGNIGIQALACGVFSSIEDLRQAIAASFPVERYDPQV